MTVTAGPDQRYHGRNRETTLRLLDSLRAAETWLETYGPAMPDVLAHPDTSALLTFVTHSHAETVAFVDWLTVDLQSNSWIARRALLRAIHVGNDYTAADGTLHVHHQSGHAFVRRQWGELYVQIIVPTGGQK